MRGDEAAENDHPETRTPLSFNALAHSHWFLSAFFSWQDAVFSEKPLAVHNLFTGKQKDTVSDNLWNMVDRVRDKSFLQGLVETKKLAYSRVNVSQETKKHHPAMRYQESGK